MKTIAEILFNFSCEIQCWLVDIGMPDIAEKIDFAWLLTL